jgi:hypothetical protein
MPRGPIQFTSFFNEISHSEGTQFNTFPGRNSRGHGAGISATSFPGLSISNMGLWMPGTNGNHLHFDQTDCQLEPGEVVKESGVYEICHSDEPRISVLLLRNTFFPYCKQCGENVRYKLIQAAPHISEDPDFLEEFPEADPDNPQRRMAVTENTSPLQLGIAHGFRFWQQIVQAWTGGSEGGSV